MGKIQKIAKNMTHAWNRSDHSYGFFYHAMNYTSKGINDAAYCGAFKRKSAEEARKLIEYLAKCNYKSPSETLGSSNRLKGSGMQELNWMTSIEAKLDALMSKIGNQEKRTHSENEMGTVDENEKMNSVEEGLAHEGPYQVKEAQYLNSNGSYNILSPTSTCQLITHQHSETMRISLLEEEHIKVKDLGRIFNNTMLHLGSNKYKNNNNNKDVRGQKIKDKEDLLPLKNRC